MENLSRSQDPEKLQIMDMRDVVDQRVPPALHRVYFYVLALDGCDQRFGVFARRLRFMSEGRCVTVHDNFAAADAEAGTLNKKNKRMAL